MPARESLEAPCQRSSYGGYLPFNSLPTCLDLSEMCDVGKVRKIAANIEKLAPAIFANSDEPEKISSTKTLILKYARLAAQHDGKGTPVHYRRAQNGVGRYHVQGISGLQGLPRLVRHTIGADFYDDLDMANCHFVLLENYCRIHDIPCPAVSHYIVRRESILREAISCGMAQTRGEAKSKVFLRMLNYVPSPKPTDSPTYVRLRDEVKRIHSTIMEKEPAFLALAMSDEKKRSWNIGGLTCGKLLVAMEVDMITTFREYLEKQGCRVDVLVHDGLMVQKLASRERADALMRGAEAYVWDKLGWRVTFTCKPMNPNALDLSGLADGYIDDFERVSSIYRIPKKKRSVSDNEFLVKFKKEQAGIAVSECTSVSEKFTTIEKLDRWIDPLDLERRRKGVVICGGLGIGKSTACKRHLDKFHYPSVAVLTPRITFARGMHTKLKEIEGYDFKFYSECKYSIKAPYVVVQAESLPRLGDWDPQGCLVVIDEVESFLYQLTSGLHKDQIESVQTFQNLLRRASKVVCLDAFVSTRTLRVLQALDIPFDYFNYTRLLDERTFEELNYELVGGCASGNFLPSLADSLNSGKKVYLVCSSQNQWMKNIKPYLEEKCPEKRILEYHSRKKSTKLSDVMEEWKPADLVMSTTTITVGLDYNFGPESEFAFDRLYVYLSSSSQTLVRDIAQGMYRVRHFREKKLLYAIDTKLYDKTCTLPWSKGQIKRDVERGGRVVCNLMKANPQVFLTIPKTPPFFKELLVRNLFEHLVSMRYTEELFKYYLKRCSYTPVERSGEVECELMSPISDFREYDDIPVITQDTFRTMERRKKAGESLTETEFWSHRLYVFTTYFRYEPKNRNTHKLWLLFLKQGSKRIKQVRTERKVVTKLMEVTDCHQNTKYVENNLLLARVQYIREFARLLGLSHSQTFGAVIPRSVLNDAIPYLREHRADLVSVFSLRDRKKNDLTMNLKRALGILNGALKEWGFSKIVKGERENKRQNGKLVDVSPYILKPLRVEIDGVLQEYEPHVYKALNVRKNIIRRTRMLVPPPVPQKILTELGL